MNKCHMTFKPQHQALLLSAVRECLWGKMVNETAATMNNCEQFLTSDNVSPSSSAPRFYLCARFYITQISFALALSLLIMPANILCIFMNKCMLFIATLFLTACRSQCASKVHTIIALFDWCGFWSWFYNFAMLSVKKVCSGKRVMNVIVYKCVDNLQLLKFQ